jgi:hypothetical protein
MAVQSLTKSRFDKLTDGPHPGPAGEVAWYATRDEKRVGAVLYDRTDKDWGYVVFEEQAGGRYEFLTVNSCIETQEKAAGELATALEGPAELLTRTTQN